MLIFMTLACGGKTAETEAAAEPAPAARPSPEAEKPPEGVKTHGNLPILTESELAAEDATRAACVTACKDRRAPEAIDGDRIDQECLQECELETPIRQVEVVPDSLELPK